MRSPSIFKRQCGISVRVWIKSMFLAAHNTRWPCYSAVQLGQSQGRQINGLLRTTCWENMPLLQNDDEGRLLEFPKNVRLLKKTHHSMLVWDKCHYQLLSPSERSPNKQSQIEQPLSIHWHSGELKWRPGILSLPLYNMSTLRNFSQQTKRWRDQRCCSLQVHFKSRSHSLSSPHQGWWLASWGI